MIKGLGHFLDACQYEYGCPDGTWTGRLDERAWGKSANLILYFSDIESGQKYWLSVFWGDGYKSNNGQNFRNDAQSDDLFELTTGKTKTGKPKLVSAVKIQASASVPVSVEARPAQQTSDRLEALQQRLAAIRERYEALKKEIVESKTARCE
jgi:hypothetical protein